MAHELATEIDETIIANPGKEAGVWNALDALYFEDQYPLNDITNDMILDKRRELEGKAGDRSGLRQMRERWCRRHKINPYDDPNLNKAKSSRQAQDPLQKITAGLYAQINDSVRADVKVELDALREQIENLESGLQETKEKLGNKARQHTELHNEHQQLLDTLKANAKAKEQAELQCQWAKDRLASVEASTLKSFQDAQRMFEKNIERLEESHNNATNKLAGEIEKVRDGYEEKMEQLKAAHMDELHKYMVENDNLKIHLKEAQTENALLKSSNTDLSKNLQAVGDTIAMQFAQTNEEHQQVSDALSKKVANAIEAMGAQNQHVEKTIVDALVQSLCAQDKKFDDLVSVVERIDVKGDIQRLRAAIVEKVDI